MVTMAYCIPLHKEILRPYHLPSEAQIPMSKALPFIVSKIRNETEEDMDVRKKNIY